MAAKNLEPQSKYEKYDLDGDGIVTDEEFEMDQKLMRLENEDKKEDAQRNMAWFALFGMIWHQHTLFLLLLSLLHFLPKKHIIKTKIHLLNNK
jgi:hypothetical protein